MKQVFVGAGMGKTKNENINCQARELGLMLAKCQNITFIQGGSCEGVMGEILKAFLEESRNVKFLIPEKYYNIDAPKIELLVGKDCFNATKLRTEADRLLELKKCDQIIFLPGGTGTLEELLYCNETFRAGEHESEVVLVNIDGFFNGFLQQIQTNIEQGFSTNSTIKFKIVSNVRDIELLDDKVLS